MTLISSPLAPDGAPRHGSSPSHSKVSEFVWYSGQFGPPGLKGQHVRPTHTPFGSTARIDRRGGAVSGDQVAVMMSLPPLGVLFTSSSVSAAIALLSGTV